MRTSLCKVTMRQGNMAIKPPKNITTILLYYLYFILHPYQNMSKDG